MADRTVLVSIIISVFNKDRYLARCIDSALGQTYPHVEIIAVDDGSTDGSRAILESYDDRINLIVQGNSGQALALRRGFGASRGGVVLFLDADDFYEPQAVEAVMGQWRPGVVKVDFDLARVDRHGRKTGAVSPGHRIDASMDRQRAFVLRHGYFPCPPSSGNAYERAFVETIMSMIDERFLWIDEALNRTAPFLGDTVQIEKQLGAYTIDVAGSNTEANRRGIHGCRRELGQSKLFGECLAAASKADDFRTRYGAFVMGPRYWARRMLSLRYGKDGHPFERDSTALVLMMGLLSCVVAVGKSRIALGTRLLSAARLVGLAVMPRRLVSRLVDGGRIRLGGESIADDEPTGAVRAR